MWNLQIQLNDSFIEEKLQMNQGDFSYLFLGFICISRILSVPFTSIYNLCLSLPSLNNQKISTKNCFQLQKSKAYHHHHHHYLLLSLFLCSDLQWYTGLYGLQLQSHAFRWKELWRDARWAQWASWAVTEMGWSVKPIPHEKVLHWYQHCMWLFFCNHWSTSLHLQNQKPFSIHIFNHSNHKQIPTNIILVLNHTLKNRSW